MNGELRVAGTSFGPGEEIVGEVSWSQSVAPREVVVRLFWQTKGSGDRDTETVWEQAFRTPTAAETRAFSLTAPADPPSFSGKLISLVWTLEFVIDGESAQLVELVIAPGGVEMELNRPEWLVMEAPWDVVKIGPLKRTK
jgi:hypothetical protein